MAIRLKKFASELTSVYAYGIVFILMATFLFPHTFMTVMAYFYLVSLGAVAAGYAKDDNRIKLIATSIAALIGAVMGLGLLGYHWKWFIIPDDEDLDPPKPPEEDPEPNGDE